MTRLKKASIVCGLGGLLGLSIGLFIPPARTVALAYLSIGLVMAALVFESLAESSQ